MLKRGARIAGAIWDEGVPAFTAMGYGAVEVM
jgi:hypothetical protein